MTFTLPARIGVFDLETSGVDVFEDRVVTAFVGLMDTSTGEMVERKSFLLDPGVEIPEAASEVHGITTEKARSEGIPAKDGVFKIMQALDIYDRRGVPLVAYNAAFDFSMLYHEAVRYGYRPFEPRTVIDPFIIDKVVDKWRKGKRTLTVTAAHYGIDIGENAHDAEADCVAAGKVACLLLSKIKQDPKVIHEKTIEYARVGAVEFQAYLRSPKNKNGADPEAVVDGSWPIRYARLENP